MSNNSLFVCYYGKTPNLEIADRISQSLRNNLDVIVYPVTDTSTDDEYYNLWKCVIRKMDYELKTKKRFSTVLAVNTDNEYVVQNLLDSVQIHRFLKKERLFDTKRNVLYYSMGAFVKNSRTAIDTSLFYADSVTFGIVGNFGVVHKEIEKQLSKSLTVGPLKEVKESFFNTFVYFQHFLKTLKIKSECINYEDSSMFKRSA